MTDHAQLEEPKTPMWLPALGAALFLLVGVWWATQSAPVAPPAPAPVASAESSAIAPDPVQAAPQTAPRRH